MASSNITLPTSLNSPPTLAETSVFFSLFTVCGGTSMFTSAVVGVTILSTKEMRVNASYVILAVATVADCVYCRAKETGEK